MTATLFLARHRTGTRGFIKGMALDILTFGEALVEVMRVEVGQPLDRPALFTGPYPSGAPFIFAMQAARLGARVAALGAVGDDAFGACLRDQLIRDGVDVSGLRTLPTHTTGVAFVAYAADGSRSFIFHIAQAAAGQIAPDLLIPAQFRGLKVLHLMGSTLSLHPAALQTGRRALELAQHAGAKVSFDPNIRPELLPPERAALAFAPFIEAADILLPTAAELTLLTGALDAESAVEHLLARYPELLIVVTQGAEGCTVYEAGRRARVPGYRVEEIDPTGAGDCFDAGFLVAWLAGETPAEAARFANACGALAVTVKGPAEGARTLAEVEAFMARHKPD